MERCALFVDAGHLLAEGGKLCLGTSRRLAVVCDYARVIESLNKLAEDHSRQQLLRMYWYDGARKGIPTLDHLGIAGLTSVKLRLGRMSGGKQKGVDSLIVRDLMTLARERAMATAYLLAGDEDLREGVKDAQEFGVRVVLLGVRSLEAKGNQAQTLIQEADEHLILERDFWEPHLEMREETGPEEGKGGTEVATLPAAEAGDSEIDKARQVGDRFAEEWLAKASTEEVAELLAQAPYVPKELDAELLRTARQIVPTRDKPWLTKAVRESFWARLRPDTGAPDSKSQGRVARRD